MSKPRVVKRDGYFYYKCDTHHIDQSNVGIASHAAAMNIAANHYHFHHQTQERGNTMTADTCGEFIGGSQWFCDKPATGTASYDEPGAGTTTYYPACDQHKEPPMTTRPTDLDSQRLIVQKLRAAASDLHDRRQALGQLGYSSDYLDGVNNAVRYLLLDAQEIEEGMNE